MTDTVWSTGIDRQLEPFLALFPPADLSDPVTARKASPSGSRGARA